MGLNDLSHQEQFWESATSPHAWQTQQHHSWRALPIVLLHKTYSTNGDANNVAVLKATIDGSQSLCNIALRYPNRRNRDTNNDVAYSLTPFLEDKL